MGRHLRLHFPQAHHRGGRARTLGSDASWFTDAATNASLLRRLIEKCHYEENRWVSLLTLGMYYLTLGRANDAHAVYREVREQFPQFVANDLTRHMLGD